MTLSTVDDDVRAAIALLQSRGIITGGFNPAKQTLRMVPSTRRGAAGFRSDIAAVLSVGGLRTTEIVDRLVERGVHVPGKNPRNTVSAHLSNYPDQFRRNPKDGTWSVVT